MQATESSRNVTDSNFFFELQKVMKFYPKLRNDVQKSFLLRDCEKRKLTCIRRTLILTSIIGPTSSKVRRDAYRWKILEIQPATFSSGPTRKTMVAHTNSDDNKKHLSAQK
jgi:hypothetical protein